MSDSWKTQLNIYWILVATAGTGKSPSMGLLTNYIKDIQYDEISKYDTPTKKSRVENNDGDTSPEATQDKEAGLFHPKQQVLEQIMPEASIVSLKQGNPCPIVLIDEFKMTGDVLRNNSNLKSVYCKAYTEGSFVYSMMTWGTIDVDRQRGRPPGC